VKPENTGTLIVGAGQAGVQFAASLRELGHRGPLTLIGGENRPPYQRPPLSKAFLRGKIGEDELLLHGPQFFADNKITLRTGDPVQSVRLTDPATGAGLAATAGGRQLAFTHLVLAVGATPQPMTVPGSELAGIHYLHDIPNAVALRAELDGAQRVAVVGGGYIGLEVAAAANAAGKDVTVIEATDRLLGRTISRQTSEFYRRAHHDRGTRMLLGVDVTAFLDSQGNGRVSAVELCGVARLEVDVVIIGIGVRPRTELAEQLGLACQGGIVVDAYGRTSIPSVFAAGDCTVLAHPEHGTLRLASAQNAIAQATVGAATLLGAEPPQVGVPCFWSDQADLKLQIAGLANGHDKVVVRGAPDADSFSVFYYRGDRLAAIDAVNAPRDYVAVRRILDAGRSVPAEAAADTSIPLKSFLTS
jgi:3-phenylpropionate/trans-cinnamate dioxygenase ferredoxin reductase subunit